MMQLDTASEFNNARYNCCCSNCHATTGAKILGYIQLLLAIIDLINCCVRSYGYSGGEFLTSLAAVILSLIAVGCILYGLHVEKGEFLINYMISQGFTIMVYICVIALGIAVLATGDGNLLYGNSLDSQNIDKDVLRSAVLMGGGTMICVGIISIILYIWFISIVLAAYRFITEKQNLSIHLAVDKNTALHSAQLTSINYGTP